MLKIFNNIRELSNFAAERFVAIANRSVEKKSRFLVALSGGTTPLKLFEILSNKKISKQIPWQKTIIFWADERCVALDHPDSNFGQANEKLFKLISIPADNVHPINCEKDATKATDDYSKLLISYSDTGDSIPRFDLVIMGLGADGHTASLFPGSNIETNKLTTLVEVKYQDKSTKRISLTSAVFNNAAEVLFLVTGESKAQAVLSTLEGVYDPINKPAQRISPISGEVHWLIDEAAGRFIKDKPQVENYEKQI
jgi:6-phosphogluconolactonase